MAGSIEKRGKDSYRLVCTNGYDLNGNIIKHTKTIHGTKKDAQIELAKFVADVQNSLVIEGNPLNFLNSQKYGKEIMVQKSLHLQHINDIAEC